MVDRRTGAEVILRAGGSLPFGARSETGGTVAAGTGGDGAASGVGLFLLSGVMEAVTRAHSAASSGLSDRTLA